MAKRPSDNRILITSLPADAPGRDEVVVRIITNIGRIVGTKVQIVAVSVAPVPRKAGDPVQSIAAASGHAVLRTKLRRDQVLAFFRQLQPCRVAMEACGGAHFWRRETGKMGHEVRLIPAVGSREAGHLIAQPDQQRSAITNRSSVAGPVRRAVTGGGWLACAASLTAWSNDVTRLR